nr:glucan endo-1,3-beta-glucosidase [Ipomoea trifida]
MPCVNYGTLGDNLPPPAEVARFLKEKTVIDRIKIFDVNPDILRAFAGTGILVTVTVPNGEIIPLKDGGYAAQWVAANIKPFYPATKINIIAVGNEVLHWGTPEMMNGLVAAMRSLYNALVQSGIKDIKVSSPHSLGIMLRADPPSMGRFRPGWDVGILAPMLKFLRETNGPFMVNPYPYFGYAPDKADLALFRPNKGYVDRFSKRTYGNMFDMLLDAVFMAMRRLGYPDVKIIAAETGWSSAGEVYEPKCTVENAASYNGGLMRKYASGKGTPLMPRSKIETYIFALFNENLKPGSKAERNFGLFRPDFTPVTVLANTYLDGCMGGEVRVMRNNYVWRISSEVKGLRFGGQFIVKSFTIRRARPLELLRLLSLPPPSAAGDDAPFPSTAAFLPTNFTILAHHAWHTLTLGLGTRKSKVVLFVFESENLKATVERQWPPELPLGEVNKKLIRGLSGCDAARFKFRKGCITFYVYAVRRSAGGGLPAGFSCADDLRTILQSVVALKDFLDHTAMLALPNQRSINYEAPPQHVAMAH